MRTLLAQASVYGLTAGLMPGPLLMVAIAQTLRHGLREGVKIAFSPLVADAPRIVLLLIIVPRLQSFSATVGVIGLLGSLYLLWLAADTWRSRPPAIEQTVSEAPRSWERGIVTSALNPNPWLFWMTAGAQLMVSAWKIGPAAPAAFLAAFFGCMLISSLAFIVIISRFRERMVYHAYRAVMRSLSVLLIVFAVLNGRDALALLRA